MPIKIQIVKHTKEKREKSSAFPLIFLSNNFSLFETDGSNWSELSGLDFGSPNNNYVLYPHKDARLISELTPKEYSEMESIKIIDCTWAQSNAMLRGMPTGVKFLKLEDYETTFWRYQLHNNKCLATVEAIYYMLREWDDRRVGGGGGGQSNESLDGVMFWYILQYLQIKGSITNRHDEKNWRYFRQLKEGGGAGGEEKKLKI